MFILFPNPGLHVSIQCLWFLFIKWMSFLDLFWVLSWLDSRCSSVKWLYPFGFIWGNEIFTSEEKSTRYGQHLLKLIWYHLFVVVVFYQSAVALFDMVEYYESACKVNIAFNKNISGRGWQGCARMIRKVCDKKYIQNSWVFNLKCIKNKMWFEF